MRVVKQSTARNVMVFMTDSTDHITGKASLTLTITASKDGAAFGSISPSVTDRGSGWYEIALTSSHTDTLGDFALHITGAAADPTDLCIQVVAYDFGDAVSLGLSRIDATVSSRSTLTAANVWDHLTAAITTANSIGKLIKDNLDVVLSTRLATVGYTAPDNSSITSIKAKTDNLPTDPASETTVSTRASQTSLNHIRTIVNTIQAICDD